MKNISRLSILTLSFILILTSCNSKFSLTKRHYTKGYYFSHSKASNNVAIKEKATRTDSQKPGITSVTPVTAEQISHTEVTNPVLQPVKQTRESKNAMQKLIAAVGKKSPPQFTPFANKKTVGVSTSQPVKASEDARSLFWIVILVLVILWALGLISGSFGLGILINLLLLIALVLLVLWLLRIV